MANTWLPAGVPHTYMGVSLADGDIHDIPIPKRV
jgi:hypothetical protein